MGGGVLNVPILHTSHLKIFRSELSVLQFRSQSQPDKTTFKPIKKLASWLDERTSRISYSTNTPGTPANSQA